MGYELYEGLNIVNDNMYINDVNMLEQGLSLEHLETTTQTNDLYEGLDMIIGNPESDMENWHLQDGSKSCAVCCQEFIAEQIFGVEFNEQNFCDYAESNGWFNPETGTSLDDVGKILESFGLDVERTTGATLYDLANDLQKGNKLICAVSSSVLDNPELAQMPGVKVDHAVQVIGIDATPGNEKVILNDSGVSDGRARVVDADTFLKAWSKGNNFVATVNVGG